jgi:CheY-like chemotaxis protein
MVEYLRSTPEAGATHVKRAVDIIFAQVNQLAYLVDDLLDLGHIARRGYKLRKVSMNFGAAIKEVAEAMRPSIEARGHDLYISVPADPIIVEADAARIAQIVSNLLDNANKYTDKAGHVSVELRWAKNCAVLDVRDSGVGISSDFLPHVFESFARADTSQYRARDGLGLGLSITKALVEMHGGQVSVSSSGRGSTFTVRLPASKVVQRRAFPPTLPKIAPQRILVVDDNAAVADSFSMLLESMGHDVSVVHDGVCAVAIARKITPRVVFIDINLPGMDGYEIACILRQNHSAEQMLLVAATGGAQQDGCVRLRQAGFDYHLAKPIDIGDVDAILSNLDFPQSENV